jgi:aspartate/methionine/tyrosine aminotransferase
MWLFGAKVVQVPSLEDEEWDPDLDKLRSSVTEKTKMICLDNPNNPTGAIYSNKARRAIIDIAGEYDIPVISDELYRQITFDEYEAPSMALNVKDVPVIMITSFSKFFMKPGWRIGYLGFKDPTGKLTEIKNACKRMASTYGHHQACIPCPVLVAATRALRGLTDTWWFMGNEMTIKGVLDESKEMLRNLQKNRDYSIKRMNEIKGIDVVKSKASLYMFPRVEEIGKTWKTTEDFILDLFEEEAVIFNNGEGYGNSGFGHFRTIIQDNLKVLEDIYDRIERFLTKRTQ